MGILFNKKDLGKTVDELIDEFGVDIDFLNSGKSLDEEEKDEDESNKEKDDDENKEKTKE